MVVHERKKPHKCFTTEGNLNSHIDTIHERFDNYGFNNYGFINYTFIASIFKYLLILSSAA